MAITKEFFLSANWDESSAHSVDGFCNDVVSNQVEKRSGTYTGTGGANTVKFAHTLGVPAILFLENSETGAVTTVLSPRPGGNVTDWTKDNFTIAGDSGFNTAGKAYRFFLISS